MGDRCGRLSTKTHESSSASFVMEVGLRKGDFLEEQTGRAIDLRSSHHASRKHTRKALSADCGCSRRTGVGMVVGLGRVMARVGTNAGIARLRGADAEP